MKEMAPATNNETHESGEHREDTMLRYFRATPQGFLQHPPLASSLQNLEQCFDLIAARRLPGALVSCAAAWESAIRAKLGIPATARDGFDELIGQIRNQSRALKMFDAGKLHGFRQARNRIMHYGYSPKDDNECAAQLLETGLPFLKACYRELFDFYLDWRDIQPTRPSFMKLTEAERAKVGMFDEMALQLRICSDAHSRARQTGGYQPSLSFLAFGHMLRWSWKKCEETYAEAKILERAEENGVLFEAEASQKQQIIRFYDDLAWEFNCPICPGSGSVVGELDDGALDSDIVRVRSCICVSCHLVIPRSAFFLADLLLRKQIEKEKSIILKERKIP